MINMIETEQKLIQIGSSEGITLSKKDIAKLGAKRGDILKVELSLSVNPQMTQQKSLREYDDFVKKYGQH